MQYDGAASNSDRRVANSDRQGLHSNRSAFHDAASTADWNRRPVQRDRPVERRCPVDSDSNAGVKRSQTRASETRERRSQRTQCATASSVSATDMVSVAEYDACVGDTLGGGADSQTCERHTRSSEYETAKGEVAAPPSGGVLPWYR